MDGKYYNSRPPSSDGRNLMTSVTSPNYYYIKSALESELEIYINLLSPIELLSVS